MSVSSARSLSKLSFYLYTGVMVTFTVWSTWFVFATGNTEIYQENALLENLQAANVLVAALCFLIPALQKFRDDRLIYIFFVYLSFAFFLREVDVEDFDLPSIIISLGSGKGRNILLLIGLLAIGYFSWKRKADYWVASKVYLKSLSGVLIITAGIALFVGGAFEDASRIPHYVYFEEMIELLGYVLMVLSALAVKYESKTH